MPEPDDFSNIPGMPDEAELRDEIVRTVGPEHWRPNGDGPAADLSGLSEADRARVLGARLLTGPGPNANAFQRKAFEQRNRLVELEKEEARLMDDMLGNRGFDPETGEPIPLLSPARSNAAVHRLSAIAEERRRISGEPGRIAMEKALEKAVAEARERHRRQYIQAEAKRLAEARAMQDEIERLAEGYRKTRPNP